MCNCWKLLQPTSAASGRSPPKIGNIGHLTRIANKLIQLGNTNGQISTYLQVDLSHCFYLVDSFYFLKIAYFPGKHVGVFGLNIGEESFDSEQMFLHY